jgi:hypothetical protein
MKKKRQNKILFEDQELSALREKIAKIMAESDSSTLEKDNARVVGLLIHNIATKGYIRAHAILITWLRELFEFGECKSQTIQELVQALPWKWHQSKKYLDKLERNNFVRYGHDPSGRKTCQLIIQPSKDEEISLQLDNLLKYFVHQATLSPEIWKRDYQNLNQFHLLRIKLQESSELILEEKREIRSATEKEQEEYLEHIISAYYSPEDYEETNPQKRLEEALKTIPLLLKGLKREK